MSPRYYALWIGGSSALAGLQGLRVGLGYSTAGPVLAPLLFVVALVGIVAAVGIERAASWASRGVWIWAALTAAGLLLVQRQPETAAPWPAFVGVAVALAALSWSAARKVSRP